MIGNEIVIRKYAVNWADVINLALNRRDWGKRHTLFTLGNVTINCVLYEFNFEKQYAWFKVKLSFSHNEKLIEKENIMFYSIKHFTNKDFSRILKSKCATLIKETSEELIKKDAEERYKQYRYDICSITEEDIITAGYKHELDVINGLPDPYGNTDIYTQCLNILKQKTENTLNIEYNKWVKDYCDIVILGNNDLQNLLEDLSDDE